MEQIEIKLDRDPPGYAPGEKIKGRVKWDLPAEDNKVEVRLFWHTTGIGNLDTETLEIVAFEGIRQAEEKDFELLAPVAPHSFSGQLVSLMWSIEVISFPSETIASIDLVISPTREELMIQTEASDKPEKVGRFSR